MSLSKIKILESLKDVRICISVSMSYGGLQISTKAKVYKDYQVITEVGEDVIEVEYYTKDFKGSHLVDTYFISIDRIVRILK